MLKKMLFLAAAVFLLLPLNTLSAAQPMSILWFNATYSPLTFMNEADFYQIGGYEINDENRAIARDILSGGWNVNDKKSADKTLEWILTEGHRSGFVDEMEHYKKNDMLMTTKGEWLKNTDAKEAEAACLARMCKVYKERGSHAIDAWDYCRALQLLGHYYVAGYYTKEESLNKSLEIAKKLQAIYNSWADLMQGYNDGYQYWSRDDITNPKSDSYTRNQVILKLQTNPQSLFNTVPWNTSLEKSW